MRILFALALLSVAAACAAPAAAPVSAATPVAPDAATPSRLAGLLAQAGQSDAPTLAAIQREAGAPDVSRRDGAGAALTYRLDTCALLLVFTADARNDMRLAQAHPGPRRTGAAAPTLAQCAAEADARN